MVNGIPGHIRFTLASQSPRRQQLLSEAGLEFKVVRKDYKEHFPVDLKGAEIAEYLALEKASQFVPGEIEENEIIITADTIVWCDGKVLDKPADYKDAFDILTVISGRTHEVITGVCLLSKDKKRVFSETTEVTFDTLTRADIDFYINNYKPFDKAGAYGIQEWIGIVGNSHIAGSYFNVMGLPVHRLLKEIRMFISNNSNQL